jgi:hypothetical protein
VHGSARALVFGGTDVRSDVAVAEQIGEFIDRHGAKSVALADRIIGCPHEEGIDYPEGTACPQCPFWANRDRWTGHCCGDRRRATGLRHLGVAVT